MSIQNQNNSQNNNQDNNAINNQGVANNVGNIIKHTAGVAFDAVQNTIQAAENIAFNVVDETTHAIDQTISSATNIGSQQNSNQQNQQASAGTMSAATFDVGYMASGVGGATH